MAGLRITACFFSFVSLVVLIVALASDYWTVAPHRKAHIGLWRWCNEEICLSFEMLVLGYIHATRAFLLIGMIAGAVSFVSLCASFSHTHVGSMSINNLAVLASFGAGACSLIAMSTFTGMYNDEIISFEGSKYSWSFGLGWASFPLFFITGGLSYRPVSTTT